MRRNDKEIKDLGIIEEILKEAQVCRIALCDIDKPYIIPMNFGFKDNYLYIHSASEGRKIDIINKNNNICFEVDIKEEIIKAEDACNWGMKYYSVIGSGKAHFIEDIKGKKEALDIIMQKYSGNNASEFKYSLQSLKKTVVIKINITEITGKKSGY
ncbi:pyridoxamine 5'-phosphate oxidase family protein [Methanobacterium sp. ACI-7]|uniref:pyridoxamine 5'-phosphate oxidase family protein n=1 Tax=unclassified Methanobacterium TaxID=2627676 RepID=UPI0039C2BE5E